MHLLDCKGVASLVIGSVLKCLALVKTILGATQDARMATINALLIDFYDRHPGTHRAPPLKIKNLTLDGWATLHGPVYKAANTRAMLPVLVELVDSYMDETNEYERTSKLCVHAFNGIYEVMYSNGIFLPDTPKRALTRHLLRFGRCYQHLRNLSAAAGWLYWNITPKVHMSQHFAALCRIINPRYLQNYSEESQVGTMTTIWGRSAHGKYRSTIQHVVLVKRLVALALRLELGDD